MGSTLTAFNVRANDSTGVGYPIQVREKLMRGKQGIVEQMRIDDPFQAVSVRTRTLVTYFKVSKRGNTHTGYFLQGPQNMELRQWRSRSR